jgi:hypothetical protein
MSSGPSSPSLLLCEFPLLAEPLRFSVKAAAAFPQGEDMT